MTILNKIKAEFQNSPLSACAALLAFASPAIAYLRSDSQATGAELLSPTAGYHLLLLLAICFALAFVFAFFSRENSSSALVYGPVGAVVFSFFAFGPITKMMVSMGLVSKSFLDGATTVVAFLASIILAGFYSKVFFDTSKLTGKFEITLLVVFVSAFVSIFVGAMIGTNLVFKS